MAVTEDAVSFQLIVISLREFSLIPRGGHDQSGSFQGAYGTAKLNG